MSAILQFPTPATLPVRERGESAAAHVDAILRTYLSRITYQGELHIMAEGAKQIRDLFRALGWSRYFRVTKGSWSLGPSIDWTDDYKPVWECDHTQQVRAERLRSSAYSPPPYCSCETRSASACTTSSTRHSTRTASDRSGITQTFRPTISTPTTPSTRNLRIQPHE